MITTYLEEAVRILGGNPHTFIYKGPWEAHPYTHSGYSVPGKH
jgi:hypothetical protein